MDIWKLTLIYFLNLDRPVVEKACLIYFTFFRQESKVNFVVESKILEKMIVQVFN